MNLSKFIKKHKVLFIILLIPAVLIIFGVLALLAGYLIQWLWAVTISDIFGVKEISYWQAVGLVVLCKILFGSTFSVSSSSSSSDNCSKGKKRTHEEDAIDDESSKKSEWKFLSSN